MTTYGSAIKFSVYAGGKIAHTNRQQNTRRNRKSTRTKSNKYNKPNVIIKKNSICVNNNNVSINKQKHRSNQSLGKINKLGFNITVRNCMSGSWNSKARSSIKTTYGTSQYQYKKSRTMAKKNDRLSKNNNQNKMINMRMTRSINNDSIDKLLIKSTNTFIKKSANINGNNDVTNDVIIDEHINENENIDQEEIDHNKYTNIKNINNINHLTIGRTLIPCTPFLWYREDQLYCPYTKIVKTDKQYMTSLIQKYNEKIRLTANEYYIIVQRNILRDANLYVSYHSCAYMHDIKKRIIPNNFNKKYKFKSTCIPLTDGFIYVSGEHNYKQRKYVYGDVHIHDGSFSPSDHFKFRINEDVESVSVLNSWI